MDPTGHEECHADQPDQTDPESGQPGSHHRGSGDKPQTAQSFCQVEPCLLQVSLFLSWEKHHFIVKSYCPSLQKQSEIVLILEWNSGSTNNSFSEISSIWFPQLYQTWPEQIYLVSFQEQLSSGWHLLPGAEPPRHRAERRLWVPQSAQWDWRVPGAAARSLSPHCLRTHGLHHLAYLQKTEQKDRLVVFCPLSSVRVLSRFQNPYERHYSPVLHFLTG